MEAPSPLFRLPSLIFPIYGVKIRETMKTSWPHWKQAPMNDTMLDLRQQDRNLDRALDPLGEAPLPDSLELAYAARLRPGCGRCCTGVLRPRREPRGRWSISNVSASSADNYTAWPTPPTSTPRTTSGEMSTQQTAGTLSGAAVKPGMHDLSDAASLVEIKPEATVSRTVLQAEGARVVLFSFDAGQVLTEHTAAVPALLQVLDGHLRITADGHTVDLRPGGLVHLAARLPHAVEAVEASRLQLTMLDSRVPA